MKRLADLDMFFNLQVENDQFLMYAPWIETIPVRVLIDHVGRPTPPAGLNQPAFAAILRLAKTGRVSVKLSGYLKFAQSPYPFEDCWPYVRALVDVVHARSLHVGVGLALPARAGTAGLRTAGPAGRSAVSECR